MNNTIDIVDLNSNNFRLHEYYIKYKKQDELGYKRYTEMWRAKKCFISDLLYWHFNDWYFNYKMKKSKEEFIQLYGENNLPISKSITHAAEINSIIQQSIGYF